MICKTIEEFINYIINNNLCINEYPWPDITCNLLTKLDYEIHLLDTKNEMNENHLSYKVLNDILTKVLKEEKYSIEAIKAIKKLVANKLLYYYKFVSNYII